MERERIEGKTLGKNQKKRNGKKIEKNEKEVDA